MQRLVFWLAYPFLWFISILSFPLFYRVSDLVYLLVFYVIRYRRKTVIQNLTLVFPEKSFQEIKKIEKKFYHHMVDMFLEMIKSLSISERELKKRFIYTNLEEINKIGKNQQSVMMACAHYASFEWISSLSLNNIKHEGFGVYKKIKNPYFDKLIRDIRQKFQATLIPTFVATKTITEQQNNGVLGLYLMVADQSPKLARARAWTDFMGIKVPVFMGTEKLSRSLDMAVVYLHVEKIKRGYYQATFKTISYQAAEEPPFEIMKKYYGALEEQIREAPEYYLWTHKRWKHRNAPIPDDAEVF